MQAGGAAVAGLFFLMIALIFLFIILIPIISLWRIFTKAGQPGWAAIIPIFNIYILIKIDEKPPWWLLLLFVPLVNVVIVIILKITLAEKFGKSGLFAVGLILLPFIFYPILAFGDAQYQGSATPA